VSCYNVAKTKAVKLGAFVDSSSFESHKDQKHGEQDFSSLLQPRRFRVQFSPRLLLALLCAKLLICFAVLLVLSPVAGASFPELVSNAHMKALEDAKNSEENPSQQVFEYAGKQYVISAENFIVHIDDLHNADLIYFSSARIERLQEEALDEVEVEAEAGTEAEAETEVEHCPSDSFQLVVKESTLKRALGIYEVVLGLEKREGLDLGPVEDSQVQQDQDGGEALHGDFATKAINAFVIDERSVVEEGLVFYAHTFRISFSERARMNSQSVLERSFARAYHVESGKSLTHNIEVNQEELADIIADSDTDTRRLSLTVAVPEEGQNDQDSAAQIAAQIEITTIDDRPRIRVVQMPPLAPDNPPAPEAGAEVPIIRPPSANTTVNRSPGSTSNASANQENTSSAQAETSVETSPTVEGNAEEESDDESSHEPLIITADAAQGSNTAPVPARTAEVVPEEGSDINFLWPALILAAVIALGVGGFFLSQHLSKEKELTRVS
jgi:hypothetical protein